MRLFRTALSVLTWCPLPKSFSPSQKELEHCADAFPLVGLLTGMILFWLSRGLLMIFPPIAAAALLVPAFELVSKGFHLDGLSDTFDGFLSSRSKERILEIMHDSRAGSMGVFAVVSVLIARFACLCSLSAETLPAACLLAPGFGRSAMVLTLCLGNYARKEGLAEVFFHCRPWFGAVLGLAVCGGLEFMLRGTLTATGAMLVFVPLLHFWCRSKIGGETGDTLGACEELSETLALLMFTLA